jgi:hypothetical protein
VFLDHEAVEALTERPRGAISPVWLRLAQAQWRLGQEPREALERQ